MSYTFHFRGIARHNLAGLSAATGVMGSALGRLGYSVDLVDRVSASRDGAAGRPRKEKRREAVWTVAAGRVGRCMRKIRKGGRSIAGTGEQEGELASRSSSTCLSLQVWERVQTHEACTSIGGCRWRRDFRSRTHGGEIKLE